MTGKVLKHQLRAMLGAQTTGLPGMNRQILGGLCRLGIGRHHSIHSVFRGVDRDKRTTIWEESNVD